MKILPKGFKDSDIGPIPQDWEVKPIRDVTSVITPPRKLETTEYQNVGMFPVIDQGLQKYAGFSDDSTAVLAKPPYILFGDHTCIVKHTDTAFIQGADGLKILKPKGFSDSRFVYYSFSNCPVPSIGYNRHWAVAKELLLPIPSHEEQQAIARALSDMDDLISSQEELLAKKRAIRQGALQELLTGRRRLPGFSSRPMRQTDIGPIPEDWEVKELGEIGVCLTTASYSKAQLKTAGDVKYIHYGDIHVKYKYLLDVGKAELPYIESCMVKQFALLQNGDLIIADASEDYEGLGDCIEVCGAGNTMCIGGLHTILYRPGKHVFAKGYICLLREIGSVYKQLATLAVGTKVYSLTANVIKQLQVPLPPYAEQEAIATVLSDMDAEITALEEELAKQRALKRGMMQELLSGRIRLPYNKPTHGKQHA